MEMMLPGAMMGGSAQDAFRTKYVPSLATVHYKFSVAQQAGEEDKLEKVWNRALLKPPSALRMSVPADHQMDLQTFFFGPMTHTIVLRPRKLDKGCCKCCPPFQFDIAADLFSPAIGTGEIENGLCNICSRGVSVTLPTGKLEGTIRRHFCSMQLREVLEWNSGETMGFRYMPCTTLCGPWRTGYVGVAPGEEEQFQIRYWDGQFIECSLTAIILSCFAPCRHCCFEFKQCLCQICETEWHYTTWNLPTIEDMRAMLLSRYSMQLRSVFGEPEYVMIGDDIGIRFNHPTFHSDINALGNWRFSLHKKACCCRMKMTESADTPNDLSKASAYDLTFRGTFNQNLLDSKDFNLALGYLILQNYFYMFNQQQTEENYPLMWLPGVPYRALMRPRESAAVYSAPPVPMMGMPPPMHKSEDFL